MAKIYTIEELKAIIIPIAKKYGIQKVYLFGSIARGDGDENSDIDLSIEKGTLKGLFALGASRRRTRRHSDAHADACRHEGRRIREGRRLEPH